MQKLRIDCIILVHALQSSLLVDVFSMGQFLGVIHRPILWTHIVDDCDLWRHFSLGGPPFGEKGEDLFGVLANVVVVDVLDSVHKKARRVVEVMRE